MFWSAGFFFLISGTIVTNHCPGLMSLPSSFSAISETQREQEELVWSQSLCGSDGRWPVQENREMQQHPQPKVEAAAHCVS